MNIITLLKEKYYRNRPMVRYWKTAEMVEAKLVKHPKGHYELHMKGEDHPFPGFPRGTMLYGKLSKLKHEIKNRVFNESWRILEDGGDPTQSIKEAWDYIFALWEGMKYDAVPYDNLVPSVKALYDGMTESGCNGKIRDIICFIFQEDDAYRNRFQWMTKFFPRLRKPSIRHFIKGLSMLEEAEVVGDMKERERLVKRILLFMVKDSPVFQKFLRVTDWNKIRLSDADKYFFRAKYFKVDWPEYQY